MFSAASSGDAAGQRLDREGLADDALSLHGRGPLNAHGVEVLDPATLPRTLAARGGAADVARSTAPEGEEIRAGWRLARGWPIAASARPWFGRAGSPWRWRRPRAPTKTIRRGVRLSGPGAVVIKAVADDHDFRLTYPRWGSPHSTPWLRAAPRRWRWRGAGRSSWTARRSARQRRHRHRGGDARGRGMSRGAAGTIMLSAGSLGDLHGSTALPRFATWSPRCA